MHRINSLCQHRLPGATVQVRVVSLCEPGELCEDHIRMKMHYGQTTRRMLIPIWVNHIHYISIKNNVVHIFGILPQLDNADNKNANLCSIYQ